MKKSILLSFFYTAALFSAPEYVQFHRPSEIMVHNINNIELYISNYGSLRDLHYPIGSGHNYMYGAGIWFGIVDSFGDTLVSIGYGPHGGESEFMPGLGGQDPSDPEVRIYMYPISWPAPQTIFPMAPQDTFSHQDSWCCYNDTDINGHIPGDTRPINIEVYQSVYVWQMPGLQNVVYLIYTVKNITADTLKDCIFSFCADPDIGNESGTWANDLIAYILGKWYIINGESLYVDNIVFLWQHELEPSPPPTWWPAAIGCDYLQSPWDIEENADKDNDGILDQYEMDSAYYYNTLPDSLWDIDHDYTPDWRDPNQIPQVGLTSLKRFTLNLEPNLDNERYMTMAGYNYKTGEYVPFDSAPVQPDDQRFLMSAGKFELAPDSEAIITVAFLMAEWDSSQQTPDTAIVLTDHYAQYIYDINWLLPEPPPPPRLSCIPGDAQITLIWDNLAETTPDPYYDLVSDPGAWVYDPYYREYDFEGYRIWRSITGQAGSWELLATCDLYNGIIFEYALSEDDTLIAENTGIYHTYVDDDEVRNGFEYFYAVTAFDYNWVISDYDSIFVADSVWYDPESTWLYVYDTIPVTGPHALTFESNHVGVSAYPRRDPANFVPGKCSVSVLSGNELLANNIELSIVYPLDMADQDMILEFGDVIYDSATYGGIFSYYLKDTHNAVLDSVFMLVGNIPLSITHAFSVFNGVSVKMNLDYDSLPPYEPIFSVIIHESGSTYPDSLTIPSFPFTWGNYFAFWPYRGNDYRIEWYSTTNDPVNANRVRVLDMMTGEEILYSPYDPDPGHLYDEYAAGWCFLSHLDVSDTLVLNGTPPATHNTKYLYINGGLVGMNKGGFMPATGPVPSVNDVWVVKASEDYLPAPVSALFTLQSIPAYFDNTSKRELNVKVVPNPYIVTNEWETRRFPPKMKFINLPSKCTIRIFNLNGELVKTLLHTCSYEPGLGQEYIPNNAGGDEWWDLYNNEKQIVANGIYIFHVQSDIGEQVGKLVVIR
jgi:hypothetical protein